MRARPFLILTTLAALTLQMSCANARGDYRELPAEPELLHDAVQQLTGVIVYDIFSPPQASRVYSYASVAAYEALQHDWPEYQSLAGHVNGLTPLPSPAADSQYYLPLAAVHAFMEVGKALTFSKDRMDSLRADMHTRFRSMGIPDDVFARSVHYGDTVARHILAWSSTDNYKETRGYPKFTVTSQPGQWVPTPPAYMDAVEPHWARTRPFVMDSSSQLRPNPPLAYDMTEGSPFYLQAKEVYEIGKSLTEDQKQIVQFWDDNPYVMHVRGHAMFATKKVTPGGHWMGITAIAARRAGADLMESAEAYVRTAIALSDGFLSCWDEKFRSNLVRPETVINAHLDERWQPLLQTPPFPEYTSGHSVISSAAATVLTEQFGEGFAFTDSVEVEFGIPARSYPSFAAAAAEAAMSRLYGGIHYRMAVEEGSVQGRRVGELVVERLRTRVDAVASSAR
jgi:hypothetical protein